jgi:hypothetical protein
MAAKAARTPLAAFRHRLVGQAHDVEQPIAAFTDMHLHIDFAGLDALESHGVDMRDSHPASPRKNENLTAVSSVG